MPSITTTTLAMDNSLSTHDPFPLDPSLEDPLSTDTHLFPSYPPSSFASPAMDLQYILGPTIMLDDQQQQQQHHHQSQSQLPFQHQVVLSHSSRPVPSSSRSGPVPPAPPPLVRCPPEHVHPQPDDAIINFDSKTRSFPKPAKPSTPSTADPYAEDFLRDMLGADKWETFSSRLFERRLGVKAKSKGKSKSGDEDDGKSGVSAIEFLVKVEVVKEILRGYVPHPYNPLKSLTHPYAHAPTGQVTLTRSTVLLLSGWSNTQFSYWARRAEAVSVLAEHDPRLRAVGAALARRLRDPRLSASDGDDDTDEDALVTGKGLDAIVDEVKKRTGKSQFLRGKHSSLDPYGTAVAQLDPEQIPPPTQYSMPTFQAERYDHGTMRILDLEPPPSMGPRPPPVSPPALPKRRPIPSLSNGSASQAVSNDSSPGAIASIDSQTASLTVSGPDHTPGPSDTCSPRTARTSARKPSVASDNNAHHFPVSDSRSEVEAGGKRKPGDGDPSSQKRARPF